MNRVVGCIAQARLAVKPGGADPNVIYALAFAPHGDPVALRHRDGGARGLNLEVRQQFRLVDPDPTDAIPAWRVSTVAYEYRLLDARGTEMLAYHWQPGPEYEGPDHPHLHVSAVLPAQGPAGTAFEIDIDKIHAPTGRVSLEAVVRMLLTELDVGHRPNRGNWSDILDAAEQRFRNARRQIP